MDIQVNRMMATLETILMGIARVKSFSTQFIADWIEQYWAEYLDKEVEVITLSKGWFMIRFVNKET